MNQIELLQKKLKEKDKDIHLLKQLIEELKQSKKEMIRFYQAEIKDLQDKIKELMSNAAD